MYNLRQLISHHQSPICLTRWPPPLGDVSFERSLTAIVENLIQLQDLIRLQKSNYHATGFYSQRFIGRILQFRTNGPRRLMILTGKCTRDDKDSQPLIMPWNIQKIFFHFSTAFLLSHFVTSFDTFLLGIVLRIKTQYITEIN